MFSTFLECSQMTGVFYHSIIHGLGFFICFMIWILHAQNNKTRFFYVLYSGKTWVFDHSERAQGSIFVINWNDRYYSNVKQFCSYISKELPLLNTSHRREKKY